MSKTAKLLRKIFLLLSFDFTFASAIPANPIVSKQYALPLFDISRSYTSTLHEDNIITMNAGENIILNGYLCKDEVKIGGVKSRVGFACWANPLTPQLWSLMGNGILGIGPGYENQVDMKGNPIPLPLLLSLSSSDGTGVPKKFALMASKTAAELQLGGFVAESIKGKIQRVQSRHANAYSLRIRSIRIGDSYDTAQELLNFAEGTKQNYIPALIDSMQACIMLPDSQEQGSLISSPYEAYQDRATPWTSMYLTVEGLDQGLELTYQDLLVEHHTFLDQAWGTSLRPCVMPMTAATGAGAMTPIVLGAILFRAYSVLFDLTQSSAKVPPVLGLGRIDPAYDIIGMSDWRATLQGTDGGPVHRLFVQHQSPKVRHALRGPAVGQGEEVGVFNAEGHQFILQLLVGSPAQPMHVVVDSGSPISGLFVDKASVQRFEKGEHPQEQGSKVASLAHRRPEPLAPSRRPGGVGGKVQVLPFVGVTVLVLLVLFLKYRRYIMVQIYWATKPEPGPEAHCGLISRTAARAVDAQSIFALDGLVKTTQNVPVLIDFQNFTTNAANILVQYYILEIPTKGELFEYISGAVVPQGKKLCCPPSVLQESRVFFVPGPNEFNQSYARLRFAVIDSQKANGDVSSISSLWSSATLLLNVAQSRDVPFTGSAGGMLYFDGLDDFAVTRTSSFPTDRFTISLWLKVERTRVAQTVFTLFSSTFGRELELSDVMDLRVLRGGDLSTVSASVFVADGRWHFIAVSWDSGLVTLVVDAQAQAQAWLGSMGERVSSEVELVLGNRLLCAALTPRQRLRAQRAEAISAATTVPLDFSVAGSGGGSSASVCDAEIPTKGCNYTRSAVQTSLILDRMDADDVLERNTRPALPPFSYGVTPGPWVCLDDDRLCVHGRPRILEALACNCSVTGCMLPRFAFSGFMDEVSIFTYPKTPLQLRLDLYTAAGTPAAGASLGRAARRYAGLVTRFSFDDPAWAAPAAPALPLTYPVDSSFAGNYPMTLGDGAASLAPLRMPSTAPLFGGYQHVVVVADGVTTNLIKLAAYSVDSSILQTYARIVSPLPVLGDLYWAGYTPRGGFYVGDRISLTGTIVPLCTKVGSIPVCDAQGFCDLDGELTCAGATCERDGYYLYYVVERIGVEISSSPFFDAAGAPLPVVAAQAQLILTPLQPGLPVSFSAEIPEDKPRAINLHVISQSDGAVDLVVQQAPSNGTLRHLFEADCNAAAFAAHGPLDCSTGPLLGGEDIEGAYPYCPADAFTGLEIQLAPGPTGGVAGSVLSLFELDDALVYRNCTELSIFEGRVVEAGINDSVLFCSATLSNFQGECQEVFNATCSCPHVRLCFQPLLDGHRIPLFEYRLVDDLSGSAVVAAALYGVPHIIDWLLRIGATLPSLALELIAAAGDTSLLRRILALRPDRSGGGRPPLLHAAAAAAKRMRQSTISLLFPPEAAAANPIPLRGNAHGRCLFPGPPIVPGTTGTSRVLDAEKRVLFIPFRHFSGGVVVPVSYMVTGYSDELVAEASITVVSEVTSPESQDMATDGDGSAGGVTWLTLPVRGYDGPALAVVRVFPTGGELYNVFVESGSSSTLRIGAVIPQEQSLLSQLPTAIFNESRQPLPAGPWRGRLRHAQVIDCSECRVDLEGAVSVQCAEAAESGTGDGWYQAACGEDGHESVMLSFEQLVYPVQVHIGSYMPASTRLRILARRPPWKTAEWSQISTASDVRAEWSTIASSVSASGYDAASFVSPAGKVVTSMVSSRLCEQQAPWRSLWSGLAGEAQWGQNGRVSPAFLPPDFPTDTLLVEACSFRRRGFGREDGGNVLEGLRAVRLLGSIGPPQGLVTDPAGRVAYIRAASASADAAVLGGSDSFTFAGYDGFRGDNAPKAISATAILRFAPLAGGRSISSSRQVFLPLGAAVKLYPSSLISQYCTPDSCSAFLVSAPVRGVLSSSTGGKALTFSPPNYLPCISTIAGSAVPAGVSLVYSAAPGSGGKDYSTVNLVFCGQTGKLVQTIRVAAACPIGQTPDPANVALCRSCPAGTNPTVTATGGTCSICPPGSFRPATTNSTHNSSGTSFLTCQSCSAGTYSDGPRRSTCTLCQAGTQPAKASAGIGAAACSACPPGTYGPGGGAFCRDCGPAAFAPVPGLSACLSCPDFTISQSMQAASKSQCECRGGAYLLSALRGESCRPCPRGAFCEGGDLPPVVRDHFWTAKEMWTPEIAATAPCNYRMVRGVCRGYPTVQNQSGLQNCAFRRVPGLCDSWPAGLANLSTDALGGQQAFRYGTWLVDPEVLNRSRPADGRTLLGSLANATRLRIDAGGCVEGYQGRMCAECSPGGYRALDGTCSTCPAWGNFITYMVWFGVWGVGAICLVYAATGRVHMLFMLLCIAQELWCVGRYSLAWPGPVMNGLNWLGLAAFSLEMLPWSCFGMPMAFMDLWYLSLFGPVIITLAAALRHLLPWLVTTQYYYRAKNLATRAWLWLTDERTGPLRPSRLQPLARARAAATARLAAARERATAAVEASGAAAAIRARAAAAGERLRQTQLLSAAAATAAEAAAAAEKDIAADAASSTESASEGGAPPQRKPVSQRLRSRSQNGSLQSASDESDNGQINNHGGAEENSSKSEHNSQNSEGDATRGSRSGSWSGSETESSISGRSGSSIRRVDSGAIHPRRESVPLVPVEGLANQVNAVETGTFAIVEDDGGTAPPGGVPAVGPASEGGRVSDRRIDGPEAESRNPVQAASVDAGGSMARAEVRGLDSGSNTGEAMVNVEALPLAKGPVEGVVVEGDGRRRRHRRRRRRRRDSKENASKLVLREGSESAMPAQRDEFGGEGDQQQDQNDREAIEIGKKEKKPLQKKKKKKRRKTTTWAAEAAHFRRQCMDAAFISVLSLLSVFLVPSTSRVGEILACDDWNGGVLSTLAADPQIQCGALDLNVASVASTATETRDKALAYGQSTGPPSVTRPVAAITMAVLLFPPQLFLVVIAANVHLYLAMRVHGGWNASAVPPGLSRRYGFLTRAFEGKYWWWNIVGSIRRLVYALAFTRRTAPYTQAFVPFAYSLFNLIGVILLRPYKIQRHNSMESAGLCLVMSILLLGLMNPTDLSLVTPESNGGLSLPHDSSITAGVTTVILAFLWWTWTALKAEVAEAQLSLRLIPIRWIRRLVMFFIKAVVVVFALLWAAVRMLFKRWLPPKKEADVGWRNPWEKDKFSVRRRIYELERQLDEEARFDSKSSLLIFLERERRRALELSLDMLRKLYTCAQEELYDNETRLEGLGQDVPAEMEIIKELEDRLREVKERNAVLNTRLDVENRKAERARRLAAEAAGEELLQLPGAVDDDDEDADRGGEAKDVEGEHDGVDVAGPGIACAQERRELRQQILSLEDRLQELELMLLDDDEIV